MRLRSLIAAAAGLVVALVAVPAAQARPAPNVSGAWQTLVPVVLTSYQPEATDPTTGSYNGAGSSAWTGTWTGVTHYAIHGTANLVTGAGAGAIDERFTGRANDGEVGTLRFAEAYTLDPAGHIHIDAHLVGATGAFTGSKATVAFEGTEYGAATGAGTYTGRWSGRAP